MGWRYFERKWKRRDRWRKGIPYSSFNFRILSKQGKKNWKRHHLELVAVDSLHLEDGKAWESKKKGNGHLVSELPIYPHYTIKNNSNWDYLSFPTKIVTVWGGRKENKSHDFSLLILSICGQLLLCWIFLPFFNKFYVSLMYNYIQCT